MRIKNRSLFQAKTPEYRIENRADEATVYLYDEIGDFGISARKFVTDLDGIQAKTIHLRINSPGGSVFDGTTIYNALKQHKARVVAHIDGLAASIASVIAMAADEVRMAKNAFFMIHDPWSIVVGSAEDMRKEADLMDKVRGVIAGVYLDRTGQAEDVILKWMMDETWFTADEAIDAGFITEIYDTQMDNSALTLFDLSAFSKVPDPLHQDTEDKHINERDLERILRDAGCSRKQAKAIIADGWKPAQRDADPVVSTDPEPEKTLRDAAPKPAKGTVEDLLIRAELIAPKNHFKGD